MIDHPLQAIQLHLETAQMRALKGAMRPRGPTHREAIQEALASLGALRVAYLEALADQSHSALVKRISEDLEGLIALLHTFKDEEPTTKQVEAVQLRIKSWHYDSRRWVSDLPLQPCLHNLPPRTGSLTGEGMDRVKRLWLDAGGAWFAPPPHPPRTRSAKASAQVGFLSQKVPILFDPMGPAPTSAAGRSISCWACRPAALIALLEVAKELLEVEIGGPNRGGHATFLQRRRRHSLKDAFAFTCLLIYETAVGPKTARQLVRRAWDDRRSPFEAFVAEVHAWVVGPEAPRSWALGPDPIRKAIATQRAWQKLLKLAGCEDADSFGDLPLDLQLAAEKKMSVKDRRHLRPPAPPLI